MVTPVTKFPSVDLNMEKALKTTNKTAKPSVQRLNFLIVLLL
jgi:hypothetical protein